ncbi:hypothetical protein D1872_180880 [compost metagenome]
MACKVAESLKLEGSFDKKRLLGKQVSSSVSAAHSILGPEPEKDTRHDPFHRLLSAAIFS